MTAVSATTTAATPTVAVVSGYSESPLPKRIDLGINLFEPGSEKFRVGAKATIATKAAELGSGTCVDVEAFQDRPALVNRRRPMEEITLARGYAVQAELEANRVVVRDVIVRKAVVHNGRAPSRRVELVVVQ